MTGEKQVHSTNWRRFDEFQGADCPEQIFNCTEHGEFRGKPKKSSYTDYVCNPVCPECEREWVEKYNEKQAEQERREAEIKMRVMNIGKRYFDSGFNTFIAETGEQKRFLKIAENYAAAPNGKLVMLGNNGTGKTHLAVSVLKQTGGIIYTVFEINVKIRQSYNGTSKEWEVLQELCETKLLVIDEIGRTKGSDFELNWISHVINKRHENMLPLILISNRHLSSDCPLGKEGCPNCLEKYFDNDVISRLIEDGIVMKFTGDDYRKKAGEVFRRMVKAGGANE